MKNIINTAIRSGAGIKGGKGGRGGRNSSNSILDSLMSSANKDLSKGKASGRGKSSSLGKGKAKEKTTNKYSDKEIEKAFKDYEKSFNSTKKANNELLAIRTRAFEALKQFEEFIEPFTENDEKLIGKMAIIKKRRNKYNSIAEPIKENINTDISSSKNNVNIDNAKSIIGQIGKSGMSKGAGKAAMMGAGKSAMAGMAGKAAMAGGIGGGMSLIPSLAGPVGIGIAAMLYKTYKSSKTSSEKKRILREIENKTKYMNNMKVKINIFKEKTSVSLDDFQMFFNEVKNSENEKQKLDTLLAKAMDLSKYLASRIRI